MSGVFFLINKEKVNEKISLKIKKQNKSEKERCKIYKYINKLYFI